MMKNKIQVRTLSLIAALAVLCAGLSPARAQNLMPGFKLGEEKEISEEEKARNKANEDAAKAASRTIAAPKAINDPWSDVRGADASVGPKSKKPK
jgi:hypothetical protein